MNSARTAKPDFDESCRFIYALVDAAQTYGVASTTMVTALSRIVRALGLQGEFIATPNYVQAALWDEGRNQERVLLVVTRSGNYDLDKLARVAELAGRVAAGAVSPVQGLARLREIVLTPATYGPLATALAYMLCGSSFAVILRGSWLDVVAGGVLGIATYGLTVLCARSAGLVAVQELLVAAVAAVLASGTAAVLAGVNPVVVTIAAIIVYVPGFGLTVAPEELLVGNTLSGIIWLTNASTIAIKLVGGAAIGFALVRGRWTAAAPASPATALTPVLPWVAAAVLALGLAVLFMVRWRSFAGILAGAWLVWGALQLGNSLGFWQGTFLGALVLTLYGNFHGRIFRVPSTVVLLPCIMLLVPGVPALRALAAAGSEGIAAGFESASAVFVLIAAIVGGAVVGDALLLLKLGAPARTVKSWVTRRPADRRDRG